MLKLLIFLAVFLLAPQVAIAQSADSQELQVPPPQDSGEVIEAPAYTETSNYNEYIARFFRDGRFYSAWVGRFLDPEPAARYALKFKKMGLIAFVLKKEITESQPFLPDDSIGDFYTVMVGLFGDRQAAEFLGERLLVAKEVSTYAVVPVDAPAELAATEAQIKSQAQAATKAAENIQARANAPLSPDSPAVTGEGFKNLVRGRYVAGFKDPMRAQQEAARLTAAGWPASVWQEHSGPNMWHRVYLVETQDVRDWQVNPQVFSEARRAAATQPGLVMLADATSIAGQVLSPSPNADRTDASACAGFSEAGRLGATLNRTLIYIPDTTYTTALVPVYPEESRAWYDIPGRISDWWDSDQESRPATQALFGPAIFNRLGMEGAIAALSATTEPGSLAFSLTTVARDLYSVPGRKVVLVFSEFLSPESPETIRGALGRLRAELSGLEAIFIYGDTNAQGYQLAQSLAREGGSSHAWDGCRLLADNGYFESFIRSVFK